MFCENNEIDIKEKLIKICSSEFSGRNHVVDDFLPEKVIEGLYNKVWRNKNG